MGPSTGFSKAAVAGEVRPQTRMSAHPRSALLLGGHGRRRCRTHAQRLTPALAALALLAGAQPASACGPEYVGMNFSVPATGNNANGEGLRTVLRSDGAVDLDPPFVIMREYDRSGPTESGAIFCSAGTVNEVKFYGGGHYDFTVYALSLVSSNAGQNEQIFTVVDEQTFTGGATTEGVHNLSADFGVGAGDFLAFAGIGPYYPQRPNDAKGSDVAYESSSEPNSFMAIPPTAGETFTVGVHRDLKATYDYNSNGTGNQGRYYGFGVFYTAALSAYMPTIPEPSSWVMMLLGFAGLGHAGYRSSRRGGAAVLPL
jgi:hypothetical protein